jgi:DNA-directed RNA polymerase subunit RPC12/RpoP
MNAHPHTRFNCDRCQDTGTIWDGHHVVRCPSCS